MFVCYVHSETVLTSHPQSCMVNFHLVLSKISHLSTLQNKKDARYKLVSSERKENLLVMLDCLNVIRVSNGSQNQNDVWVLFHHKHVFPLLSILVKTNELNFVY
jgi:hypothetical protein